MSDETEWVLVPREPSAGMWDSAENAMVESECAYNAGDPDARSDAHGFPTMRIWQAVVGYRAMLAAAPQPPAEAQAQGVGGASVLRTAAEYHYAQAACPRVQSGNTSSHRNPRLEAWHRQVADAIASVTAPPSAPVGVGREYCPCMEASCPKCYAQQPAAEARIYQCPRCATSLEVDPTAKPAAVDGDSAEALKFLLSRIGSWTNARWDQHLRHEFGDERAERMIAALAGWQGGE